MSQVYDALQQCIPGQTAPGAPQKGAIDALFPEQLADSPVDRDAAPTVELNISTEEKMPALFSTFSFASEQFRLLATRLQQMRQSRGLKSVLLTSSVAQDGRSLLTLNLAMSLSQGGQQRILVVDADLRKPGVCSALGVGERAGLREWYQNDRPITEFIFRIAGVNVWVLPAGGSAVDPLDLLKSPRTTSLLSSLNAAFDWVLIDSPPLVPLADAEILSRISDGTIVVVRRHKSSKTALKQGLQRIDPSRMIGFLLNEFPSIGERPAAGRNNGHHPENLRAA